MAVQLDRRGYVHECRRCRFWQRAFIGTVAIVLGLAVCQLIAGGIFGPYVACGFLMGLGAL